MFYYNVNDGTNLNRSFITGGIVLKNMPDELLVNAYYQALSLNLNPHFISLLKLEINRRSIATRLEKVSSQIG